MKKLCERCKQRKPTSFYRGKQVCRVCFERLRNKEKFKGGQGRPSKVISWLQI